MSDRKLCLNGCFQLLPLSDFGRHPRTADGYASRCRPCEADRMMLSKHGMTRQDKENRATEQSGCATCGSTNPGTKGWVVDHDRACCPGDRSCPSCRRGILCQPCNVTLGYAKDNPAALRRMADYLELGTRMSEVQVDLQVPTSSPKFNTDGQDGHTYEEVGYGCRSLSVATTRATGDSR